MWITAARASAPKRWYALAQPARFPLNQWSHIAGTYDGAALNLYVDGILQSNVPFASGIFPGTDDLAIGGTVGGAANGGVIVDLIHRAD